MGIFSIILLVFFAVVCLLLIFMVVIQDQDGDGLGGLFSGAGNAAFGSRSSNIVVRFTYILGGLFFAIAFGLAIINRSPVGNVEDAVKSQGGQGTEWWQAQPAADAAQPATVPAATEAAPAATGSGN